MDKNEILLTLVKSIIEAEEALEKGLFGFGNKTPGGASLQGPFGSILGLQGRHDMTPAPKTHRSSKAVMASMTPEQGKVHAIRLKARQAKAAAGPKVSHASTRSLVDRSSKENDARSIAPARTEFAEPGGAGFGLVRSEATVDKNEILLTLAKNILEAEEKLEKADFFNQIKKHPVYGHAFKEAKHYGMSDDEAHEHAFRALQQSNPNVTKRLREVMAGMNNGKY